MKPVIAFVTGGYSSESVISYKSAVTIENNLDTSKYEVFKIDITPDGWWYETSTGRRIPVDRSDFTISADGRKVAFDAEGKPTKAAAGFARGQGVPVDALVIEATPKGEYVAVRKRAGGVRTIDFLAEALPEVIRAIPFPKAMRWGDGELRPTYESAAAPAA